MKTLVLVDIQNDFMPGGALEVKNGDKIVPIVNKIQDKFDLLVATQDWHPEGHISFASQHKGKKPFEKIDLDGMEQILWPDHCVRGSNGAEFHSDLKTLDFEAIIRKGTDGKIDSYSAFYDNNHDKSTGLAGFLREKGVKEVHFVGLAADICVNFTINDAVKEGFKCILIEDGTYPWNPDDYEDIRKDFKEKGVKIINSEEI